MGFIRRLLHQTATYWEKSSYDEFGDPSFSTPVTVSVRWENRTEKFMNVKGEEEQSRAVVYASSTEFAIGGYLYLGTSTTANPETVSGADQIRQVNSCPDIRDDTETLYKAYL